MYQIATNLSDNFLTVSYNGRSMQISVTPDGDNLQVCADEDIEWVDKLHNAPAITISGRRVQATKPKSRSSKTSSTPAVSSTRVRSRKSMGNDRIDEIVSYFQGNPELSSRDVAKAVFGRATRANVQRVAGVKSSFTKGLYNTA